MRNLNKLLLKLAPITPMRDVNDAKAAWATFRLLNGLSYKAVPLLTAPDGNYKFAKTPTPVYGLSLSADKASGEYSVCDFSTPECRKGCVAYAGQGEAPNVQEGRAVRTKFLAANPSAFVTLLADEIGRAIRKHYVKDRAMQQIGVRLNAFSDLEWERIAPFLFERFIPEAVQFYDYTKRPFGSRQTPPNYHLTYSVSERTDTSELFDMLARGANVAVVLNVAKNEPMPEAWGVSPNGIAPPAMFEVVDGDAQDARYVDVSMGGESGKVIGLRPKGRMRKFPVGPNHMIREVQ